MSLVGCILRIALRQNPSIHNSSDSAEFPPSHAMLAPSINSQSFAEYEKQMPLPLASIFQLI